MNKALRTTITLPVIIVVIALVGVLAYSQRVTLAEKIMAKGLQARLTADALGELPDGLHLTLCGAGGPMPAPKASGPCVAVIAGDQFFVVDAGTDGVRNLNRMGYQAGAIIAALAVAHDPIKPAVAYRFTYKGRSLLISGDTVKSANIEQFSQGIDLLVHEGLAPNLLKMMNVAATEAGNPVLAKISHDVQDYHTSPVEAAEIARDAKVGHLLYYHVVPPIIFRDKKFCG